LHEIAVFGGTAHSALAAEIRTDQGARCAVYREIQCAEQGGLITSRKIRSTRLVRANTARP
jgi:hypothetical protein